MVPKQMWHFHFYLHLNGIFSQLDIPHVGIWINIVSASIFASVKPPVLKKSLLVGENISRAAHLLKLGRPGTEESFHFVGNVLKSF